MSDQQADRRRGESNDLPRYSELPLPPYSYVPGVGPHPVSDPAGHMHGVVHDVPPALDPWHWGQSPQFLFGIDLFNQGYYWEAHEAWESLWHAAGRQGTAAAWLKCLIKLAAAGVKAREGNPRGVQRHAERALQLLSEVRDALARQRGDSPPDRYCGIELSQIETAAKRLQAVAASDYSKPHSAALLPWWFELKDH